MNRINDSDMSAFVTIEEGGTSYEILLPHSDEDYIQKLIRESAKPYELEMLRDMALRLKPGDLVLDVGANVGNHALYLAIVAQARVIAFEPNRELAQALDRSVDRNQLHERLSVMTVGLGRSRQTAHFKQHMPSNLGAQSLEVGEGDVSVVPADELTLPGRVRMMKVDVEGMEMEVLEGAAELIRRDRPLLYVESQDEKTFRRFSNWALANGYGYWETFNVLPTHLFRPIEEFDLNERMERLAAREVIQEYRYNIQLRRARRFQKAAEDASAALKQNVARLEQELASSNAEVRRLYAVADSALARLAEVQDSTLYLASQAMAQALTSWRGLVRLPLAIARLARRGFRRRRQSIAGASTAATQPVALSISDTVDFIPAVARWVESTPKSREALSVLYADINVNVVDGSSVWLSSMASMLCSAGPCILVSKAPVTRDVIVSNISSVDNLLIMEPTVVDGLEVLSVLQGVRMIEALDTVLPKVKRVVVRGLDASAQLLATRQFHNRAAVYLTDFSSINNGRRESVPEQRKKLDLCVTRADIVLAQTTQIQEEIRALSGRDFDSMLVPPVIPDRLPALAVRDNRKGARIKIGYAGKVNSRWGVIELLEWAERLGTEGMNIELHIVADKISNGPDPEHANLREVVIRRMREQGARHYTGLNREAAMALMAEMDFVWCYRPPVLETNTLELSTKLIEMVASGARCICFPNDINQQSLGADYPFYIRNLSDLRKLLALPDWAHVSARTIEALRERHSLKSVAERVLPRLLPDAESPESRETIVFAGHDFKFIDSYISHLKAEGVDALRDAWQWGEACDLEQTRRMAGNGSVIFCEWGLANAVWYSKNIGPEQKLFVRIHAQEVRPRAQKFGREIDIQKVTKAIFVSTEIRDRAMQLWGWPIEKTVIIPNYVLDNEFIAWEKPRHKTITLGVVGIVPQLKRFDRAVDLLQALLESGHDAQLRIKGHRPEDLAFMNVPGRQKELDYYREQYSRIDSDPKLASRVHFDPWGSDVSSWYKEIDVILSCSESESFHYALADGVLSGCYPIVWPWPGAEEIYRPDWIAQDLSNAVARTRRYSEMPREELSTELAANRQLVVSRYGRVAVFRTLTKLIQEH